MNPSAMEWEWGLEGRRNDGEADTSSHSGHFLPEALQKKHIVDSDITRVGLDLLPALRTALSRLEEIGDSVAVALLRRVISDMRHTPSTESGIDYSKLMSNEASESAVSDLYWYLMDQINGLHWRDVAKATRDAFSAMSLFVCKQALSAWSGDELALKEMYKVCDIAILLGSDFAYDELQNLLHQLDQISAASFATISDEKHIKVHPSWRHPVCCKSYLPPILQPRQKRLGGVLELAQPVPISTLRDDFMSRSVPVKFKRGIIEHWPARGPGERAWNNVDYILRGIYLINTGLSVDILCLLFTLHFSSMLVVAGHRTVPVELGNYLSDASSQALMTVDEFVHTFLINDLEHNVHESNEIDAESELSPSGPPERKRPRPSPVQKSLSDIGYLAQHRLLHQVSQLRRDISIPDYCSILLPEDLMQDDTEAEDIDQEEDDVQVNAWLGPVGTVSPLHHDPYHNLLAQVHGEILNIVCAHFIFYL